MKYSTIATRVINHEVEALKALSKHIVNISDTIDNFITKILKNKGKLVLSGIGKSGQIARKIAASFSSTGCPAYYIHPTEASHGDLGLISFEDIVLILSNSGQNNELINLIQYCCHNKIYLVSITMNSNSVLAQHSNLVLTLPKFSEVSKIIAPTSSSLMMLALGDALMTAVHESQKFTKDKYYRFHPAGNIGINLTKITEVMIPTEQVPLIRIDEDLNLSLNLLLKENLDAGVVVNHNNQLCGIITFRDIIAKINNNLTKKTKVNEVMQFNVPYIVNSALLREALNILNNENIMVLPVCNENQQVVGIVHQNLLYKFGLK